MEALKCSHRQCESNPLHRACITNPKWLHECPSCKRQTMKPWSGAGGRQAAAVATIDLTTGGGSGAAMDQPLPRIRGPCPAYFTPPAFLNEVAVLDYQSIPKARGRNMLKGRGERWSCILFHVSQTHTHTHTHSVSASHRLDFWAHRHSEKCPDSVIWLLHFSVHFLSSAARGISSNHEKLFYQKTRDNYACILCLVGQYGCWCTNQ